VGYAKEKKTRYKHPANVITNEGCISSAATEQGFPICLRLRLGRGKSVSSTLEPFTAYHLPPVELQLRNNSYKNGPCYQAWR